MFKQSDFRGDVEDDEFVLIDVLGSVLGIEQSYESERMHLEFIVDAEDVFLEVGG
jgi:hypothetical protein